MSGVEVNFKRARILFLNFNYKLALKQNKEPQICFSNVSFFFINFRIPIKKKLKK